LEGWPPTRTDHERSTAVPQTNPVTEDAGRPGDGPVPARPLALLLPGQGSQHPHMAAGLYERDAVFTAAMDEVFDELGADGSRMRDDWLAETPRVPPDHVTRSQPLLFAVDHALARAAESRGVRPRALLGHSVGELAGGVLAGIFELRDAAWIIWDRAQRLALEPPGGMLAVAAAPGEVAAYLAPGVGIGAVNAPRQIMLAGPVEPLARTEKALRAAEFACREVRAGVAFHSPSLSGAVSTEVFTGIKLGAPRIELWSAYSAAPLTAELARSPEFWAGHPVEPVLFGPALDGLLGSADYLLVEAGPGQGLSALARRHPRVRGGGSGVVSLLPAAPRGPEADLASVRTAFEALRRDGYQITEKER
jgi:[acyl-carrier-protein] S-malonyltransferase